MTQFRPRVIELGCYFSKVDAPPLPALDPVTVVAKLASILDRCREGSSFAGREGQPNSTNRSNESAVLRGSHRRHVEGEGVMTSVELLSFAALVVCSPLEPEVRRSGKRMQEDLMIPPNDYWAPAVASGLSLRGATKHHHDGQASPRQGQKQPVLSPTCNSMTAPHDLERSEGQQLHSVLESASPWIVQTRRLSRYPLFPRRSLNCLRLSRTRDSKGSVAAPHWNNITLGPKARASPTPAPVSTHRSLWIPRRTVSLKAHSRDWKAGAHKSRTARYAGLRSRPV